MVKLTFIKTKGSRTNNRMLEYHKVYFVKQKITKFESFLKEKESTKHIEWC